MVGGRIDGSYINEGVAEGRYVATGDEETIDIASGYCDQGASARRRPATGRNDVGDRSGSTGEGTSDGGTNGGGKYVGYIEAGVGMDVGDPERMTPAVETWAQAVRTM